MDPIDRRRLPVTQFGWSSLLAIIQPILIGALKAGFSMKWGPWDAYHVTFSISLWIFDIVDLFWGAESEPRDMNDLKLTKGQTLQFQLVSFLATAFILGPGWLWLVLLLKIVLMAITVVVTLRTSVKLVDIDRCPKWIQAAHAKYLVLFPLYRKVAIATAIRTVLDAHDYFDAVRWYTIPWALRLAGQYVEERFAKHREKYMYIDLDKPDAQIRLLRIHRQYLFWGHVRCSMQAYSLHEVPQYEALSYRWGFGSEGTELQYRTIFVNSRTLRVPKSAWEMLHARTSRHGDHLVWIDSICINQGNKAEKSAQIPLMDRIYTKAERTVVWPGDRFDSGMASRMLLRLYTANYTFNAKDEEFLLLFEYEIVRRGWQAMIALFENSYFTRIWCVQEVALGKRVEVFHGNKYIPWEIFIETLTSYKHPRRASLLAWSTEDAMDTVRSPNSPGGPSGIMVMEQIRQQQLTGVKAQALHIGLLLTHCANFEATEGKDRIFGINGLIFGSHKVTPNYDLAESEVFIAASILAVKQLTHPFATFTYAGIGWGPQVANVPSWVVDWARPCKHSIIWNPFHKASYATGQSTAIHLPPGIFVDASKGVVRVKGFALDTIWNQIPAVTRASNDGKSKTKYQRLLLRSQWYLDAGRLSRSRFEHYPFSDESREEAFWRTVITDQSVKERPAPQYMEANHILYRKLCEARLSVPLEDSMAWIKHIISNLEILSLWPSTLEEAGQISEFSALFAGAIDGRRFAVTESGLMCLTPSESKDGDTVAIFYGAPTPFLLRKLGNDLIQDGMPDDAYQLVGECYVHGFMNRFDHVPGFNTPPAEIFTIM